MKFVQKSSFELGDTPLPDLFILNYMPQLENADIKIYLEIMNILCKYRRLTYLPRTGLGRFSQIRLQHTNSSGLYRLCRYTQNRTIRESAYGTS